VLLFAAYAVVFHHLSAWYVLYGCLAVWVALIPPVVALVDRSLVGRVRMAGGVLVAVALVAMCVTPQPDFEPGQLDKYRAVNALGRWVPSTQVVGAMNDGLVAFFRPGGSLDLDGVVDHDAIGALRDGRMCQYVADHGVGWFLDDEGSLQRLLRLGPGLVADPVVGTAPALGQPVVGQPQVLARLLRPEACPVR
jgi:hypothetical protein